MRRWMVGVIVAGFVLGACGMGFGVVDEGDLAGRSFASVSVEEEDVPRDLVGDTRIEMEFEDRGGHVVVRWRAGCNTAGAPVEIGKERLRLTSQMDSTAMGCENELHEQDHWLAGFYSSQPQLQKDDDRLTLTSGTTVIEFEEVDSR